MPQQDPLQDPRRHGGHGADVLLRGAYARKVDFQLFLALSLRGKSQNEETAGRPERARDILQGRGLPCRLVACFKTPIRVPFFRLVTLTRYKDVRSKSSWSQELEELTLRTSNSGSRRIACDGPAAWRRAELSGKPRAPALPHGSSRSQRGCHSSKHHVPQGHPTRERGGCTPESPISVSLCSEGGSFFQKLPGRFPCVFSLTRAGRRPSSLHQTGQRRVRSQRLRGGDSLSLELGMLSPRDRGSIHRTGHDGPRGGAPHFCSS